MKLGQFEYNSSLGLCKIIITDISIRSQVDRSMTYVLPASAQKDLHPFLSVSKSITKSPLFP